MKDRNDGRDARAEMEAARASAEKRSGDDRLPRRYRLYDKIKEHVSLRTIDTVIAATSLLIIALLIYGIVTGNPTR